MSACLNSIVSKAEQIISIKLFDQLLDPPF